MWRRRQDKTTTRAPIYSDFNSPVAVTTQTSLYKLSVFQTLHLFKSAAMVSAARQDGRGTLVAVLAELSDANASTQMVQRGQNVEAIAATINQMAEAEQVSS